MDAPIAPVVPMVVPPVVIPDVVPPVIPQPIIVPSGKVSTTNVVIIAVCFLVIAGIIVYKYKTSQNNAPTQ